MADLLKREPAYAVDLLNAILEDGEQAELSILLRQMESALGDVALRRDQG